MTFLSALLGGVGDFLLVLVPFLIVLTIVVFVHEWGHFQVARWCGVKVKAFSIGFGKELYGFNDRHGTRWRLALLPLGGYVKFMDDENGASVPSHEAIAKMTPEQRAGSFHLKPVWQRAAVVAAGPIANFILAILVFAGMFLVNGMRITAPKVQEVMPDTPAAVAGFKPGDVIVAIDGTPITSFSEVVRIVSMSPDRPLVFKLERNGGPIEVDVVPKVHEEPDGLGGTFRRGLIGVRPMATPETMEIRSFGPIEALGLGVRETKFIITSTFSYLKRVVVGEERADQLGGPIRIAEVSSQMARISPEALLSLVAIISVSVGLINLFPIPLLDGGHLMFYAIEALRRRPLSENTQEMGYRIGLALVLALMVFSTWNDRFIVWKWLTGEG